MPEETFTTVFKFESQVLSFVEAFDMRKNRHGSSQESLDYWNSLDKPYQEALIHLMKMACEVLYKDAENWVPFCLLPYTDSEGASFVSISSGFLTSDIEAQMEMLVAASEFELEEAKRKLRETFESNDKSPELMTVEQALDLDPEYMTVRERVLAEEVERLR